MKVVQSLLQKHADVSISRTVLYYSTLYNFLHAVSYTMSALHNVNDSVHWYNCYIITANVCLYRMAGLLY